MMYGTYGGTGNFQGYYIFCEKSKEGSRTYFRGFIFRDCRAVDHAHREPLVLVHVCKLVFINFRR